MKWKSSYTILEAISLAFDLDYNDCEIDDEELYTGHSLINLFNKLVAKQLTVENKISYNHENLSEALQCNFELEKDAEAALSSYLNSNQDNSCLKVHWVAYVEVSKDTDEPYMGRVFC